MKFSDGIEFIDELKKSKFVEPVLRLTNLYKPSQQSPHTKHVYVLATALQKIDTDDGVVLELVEYCGDDWGRDLPKEREQWKAVADVQMKEIQEAASALNLEIRCGRYEPVYYC